MKKLLVTGASGFLGWNVLQQARDLYQVTGLYHQHEVQVPGVDMLQVDLCDKAAIEKAISSIQPEYIVHCAAASKPNFCEENKSASERINVDATQLLSELCKAYHIKLVFTSTDLVFDGSKGNYTEEDATGPLMEYGRQKLRAEKAVLEVPNAAVCRMPLMYGDAPAPASSFLQGFLSELQQGKALNLFTDEYRSPVHGEDAAKGLIWAAEHAQGILHMGGKERMSRYEFGQLMCEVFELDPQLIQPALQSDFPSAARRAADASMNSRFALASGYKPRKVKEGLEAYASR